MRSRMRMFAAEPTGCGTPSASSCVDTWRARAAENTSAGAFASRGNTPCARQIAASNTRVSGRATMSARRMCPLILGRHATQSRAIRRQTYRTEAFMRKLLLIATLLLTSAASAAELSETIDRTFDVRPGAKVVLSNVNGRITIGSWDQPRVRVVAEKEVDGDRDEL